MSMLAVLMFLTVTLAVAAFMLWVTPTRAEQRIKFLNAGIRDPKARYLSFGAKTALPLVPSAASGRFSTPSPMPPT